MSGLYQNNPDLDIVIRSTDLSVPKNVHQFYEGLRNYKIETWINNAGIGNYNNVADQDLNKISMMLNLNIGALTILSSLYVRDYRVGIGTERDRRKDGGKGAGPCGDKDRVRNGGE